MIYYIDQNDELNTIECQAMYMKAYRRIIWEFPDFFEITLYKHI